MRLNRYTPEFRNKALHMSDKHGSKATALKLDIPVATIYTWRKYRRRDERIAAAAVTAGKPMPAPMPNLSKKAVVSLAEAELAALHVKQQQLKAVISAFA